MTTTNVDPVIRVDIPDNANTYDRSGGHLQIKVKPGTGGDPSLVELIGRFGVGMDYDAYRGTARCCTIPTTVVPASVRAWVEDNLDLVRALADTLEGVEWDGNNCRGHWTEEAWEAEAALQEAILRAVDQGIIHQRWEAVEWLQDGIDVDDVIAAGSDLREWALKEQQNALESGAVIGLADLVDVGLEALNARGEEIAAELKAYEGVAEEGDEDDINALEEEATALHAVLQAWKAVTRGLADDEGLEDRVAALREEARRHGDSEMAALCGRALEGDEEARDAVAEALADAEAQAGT